MNGNGRNTAEYNRKPISQNGRACTFDNETRRRGRVQQRLPNICMATSR